MKPMQKGMLIGVAIAVVPVFLMGATNYEIQKTNKFELHPMKDGNGRPAAFVLNTETGETSYLVQKERWQSRLKKK